jgi:EAL domain-containing protein (putative c-di-GMP-specific phosphodiesterase class I)
MAEETGLILPLGRYVLDTACRQVRAIRDRLDVDLPMSVNLSPRQFQESGLSSQTAAALDAVGLPSELLIFEITENVVMKDLAGAREVMKKLDRLGVRLAIDDFGTGHSSLAYLKQFPVQEIKVDRTFVQGIVDSPVDSAIVRAVIDLANAMGISMVAEGVETEDQLAGLRMLGCPVAHVAPGVLTKYGPWLRRAVGKVHFAGTETSDYWQGYMDGAVRAGERAASEAARALHS